MKRLIILLFLFSTAYGQTDSSTFTVGGNSNTIWMKGVLAPWQSIDGITARLDTNGDTLIRVNYNSQIINAQEAGLFFDGVSRSGRLDTILQLSWVRGVKLTQDGRGDSIRLTSTVNFNGKLLEIESGIKVGGTGGISNAFIKADPRQQIFTKTVSVTNIKSLNGEISALWFGADGNGSTDNKETFDKIETAISDINQVVKLYKGDYRINSSFSQTRNWIGEDSAIVKYNTASSDTAITMWTINRDSIFLNKIWLDGSSKVRRLIYVSPNKKNVRIIDNNLGYVNQNSVEISTVEIIYFTQGNDNLYIARNYIHHADAKNDGICRGVRGDYAGAAPRNVIIEDNTFDEIHDTFAGSDDSDDICIQSYTGLSNFVIRRNKHNSIWKRGIKLMVNGARVSGEQFNSTRYSAYSQRAYSAISIYGSNIVVEDCTVNGGIYDNTIEIGANGQSYKNIWVSNVKCYTAYDASLITGADGFRWFGDLENVHVDDVFTQYNRYNYYIDATYRDLTLNKAIGNYSSSNAFTSVSGSVKWGYALKVTNCKAKKSGNSIAYDFWRVYNPVFTGNEQDSCGNGLPNTVTIRVDSLLGYTVCHSNTAIGTWTTQPNYGTWANRPAFSNSNAGIGWEYTASDSGNAKYIHVGGGVWAKFGGGGSGVSGTYTPSSSSSTNVSSSTFATCNYSRVDKLVTVWGEIEVTQSVDANSTSITFNLPSVGTLSTNSIRGSLNYRLGTGFLSESSGSVRLDFIRDASSIWTDNKIEFQFSFFIQ